MLQREKRLGLLKRLAAIGLSLAVLFNLLLMFAIDDTPLLEVPHAWNRDDIERAKQLLQLSPEEREGSKTIVLDQKDINIAASYLLNHFVENTVAIQMGANLVWVQIAVYVPKTVWGRYLDFSFKLRQTEQGIRIKSLKIGEISIPDSAANLILPWLGHLPPFNQYWQLGAQYVQEVQFIEHGVQIRYLGAMVEAAKQLARSKHRDYPNLDFYQQQINEIVLRHDPAWRLSLAELLQPLFESAYRRSDAETAIRENRAVIIAVGSYIFKQDLRGFLPLGLVYAKDYPVYAYKRVDIPQHFIASALLATVDAKLLSERIGVDKELSDAETGSGFSFIDLLADRTGTRFGELAIASPQTARAFQAKMAGISDYQQVVPDIQGLPEQLEQQAFAARFGNTQSPLYQAMLAEIDKRIAELPLYGLR
ncbi:MULTISPECIES: hypothetical protein [Methylomonas]|uniref:hypothetical protein n=1 Tax=Methylomonas TaxID=416 RepID=UPI001231F19B|nr:hypothetical protein [Methylomonas rhizoryzae]